MYVYVVFILMIVKSKRRTKANNLCETKLMGKEKIRSLDGLQKQINIGENFKHVQGSPCAASTVCCLVPMTNGRLLKFYETTLMKRCRKKGSRR